MRVKDLMLVLSNCHPESKLTIDGSKIVVNDPFENVIIEETQTLSEVL